MANPGRPIIARAPSKSTFYQVRGPTSPNSNSDALGINYPAFALAVVVIAGILFFIRSKDRGHQLAISAIGDKYSYDYSAPESRTVEGIGLYLKPEPLSDLAGIQNLTGMVQKINAGTFQPKGSALG